MTPGRRSGLVRTAARQRRNLRTGRAPSAAGLFRGPGARLRSPIAVIRIAGLVSHGRQGHRNGSGPSVVGFPTPLWGWFNTPGLLRATVVRAHAEHGVNQPVRCERLASFTCQESGFATAGVTTRRSAGRSHGVALSNRGVGRRSFDRPVQHANGAVAPDRLCDHGAEARGSFATLGGCKSEQWPEQFRTTILHTQY